jgi:hypothetical protein
MSVLHPRFLEAEDSLSKEQVDQVEIGTYVKVANDKRTYWLQVVEFNTRGYFTGVFMEKGCSPFPFGAPARFHKRHILELKNHEV